MEAVMMVRLFLAAAAASALLVARPASAEIVEFESLMGNRFVMLHNEKPRVYLLPCQWAANGTLSCPAKWFLLDDGFANGDGRIAEINAFKNQYRVVIYSASNREQLWVCTVDYAPALKMSCQKPASTTLAGTVALSKTFEESMIGLTAADLEPPAQ
jgi:hypothetical protein